MTALTRPNQYPANSHSYRNATIGSIPIALHAGSQHAAIPTTANNPAITTNVPGSVAETSNNKLRITRVTPTAPTTPTPIPINANRAPSANTNRNTSPRCAPRAMQIPISCLRCPTRYAIVP